MFDLPQTRHSLLLRLADHSQDAWTEFVAIYEQSVIAVACRKGLQNADALDAAQDVLRAVEAKLPSWKMESRHGSFRGWLLCVARNIAVDKINERLRRPKTGVAVSEIVETDAGISCAEFDFDFARETFAWAVEKARPSFSPATWSAFWITAVENRKPADAAEATGLTVGNVYAAKFRVMAKLQKLVQQFQVASESEEGPSVWTRPGAEGTASASRQQGDGR